MTRSAVLWCLAAVAGVFLVAGVTLAASSLSTQAIGLSSEPLSAGEDLAPRATATATPDRRAAQRRAAVRRERQRRARARRTPQPTPVATPVPTAVPTTAPGVEPGDDSGGHGGGGNSGHGGGGGDD